MPPKTVLNEQKAESLVKAWISEINDALKREKKYRQLGQECVKLYEAKNPEDTPFAILYSNTETLAPAVYNATPIPLVTRRYKDADPVGKSVSEVSTRILKYLVDTSDKDYDSFDDLMQPGVLDALLTNRGLTRFRYVARGDEAECVYGESVRWDKFLHGYARTWKKVPWIAFEWDMSKDELKKNFPDAPLVDLRSVSNNSDGDEDSTKAEDRDELAGVKTYKVYEIWDKTSSKVIFISPCCPKQPLRYIDDPLSLSSFFPTPRPLNFMKKVTTLVPTPLYQQYRRQAAELNDITSRLRAIIKAIRYRGAYNSAVEGIEKMLNADDNQLVPVENVQSMPDGTAMDKLLWIVPVNELAATAQQLYAQREQCKQVIYEITGISDILRGASVASETATAQNIKNQWGTLRLKKMQKEVQRYCRDALAIMLEIAAGQFEIPTLQKMTGLPYLTNAQKAQIQAGLARQAAQAAVLPPLQAPQPGQPPQPAPQAPPPPQLPPEIQMAMSMPSWEDVVAVMKNDVALHYKVDIETNSTIDAEAAQDKQDISELLNAIGQFLNSVAPMVEQGVLPMEVAKSMLLVITRRFNFGSQLEDALNMMQAPQPKPDPSADAKAQTANAAAQVATINAQTAQVQGQTDQAKAKLELEKMAQEAQFLNIESANKQRLMLLQGELDQQGLEIKKAELAIQASGLAQKAASQERQHTLKMAALAAKNIASAETSSGDA